MHLTRGIVNALALIAIGATTLVCAQPDPLAPAGDEPPPPLATTFAPWTTVGSAGAVDEGDLGIFEFFQGRARILAAVPVGDVYVRYNVTATGALTTTWDNWAMTVRFLDNGYAARVRVIFKEYNYFTGVTSTIATLDSNAYAPSPAFQTQTVKTPCWGWSPDFFQNAYYVETIIEKMNTAGTPELGAVAISGSKC